MDDNEVEEVQKEVEEELAEMDGVSSSNTAVAGLLKNYCSE